MNQLQRQAVLVVPIILGLCSLAAASIWLFVRDIWRSWNSRYPDGGDHDTGTEA